MYIFLFDVQIYGIYLHTPNKNKEKWCILIYLNNQSKKKPRYLNEAQSNMQNNMAVKHKDTNFLQITKPQILIQDYD